MTAKKSNKPRVTEKAKAAARKNPIKAKHSALYRELSGIAKHANAALAQAEKADARADDLRLTAAQYLAQAKEKCDGAKLKFEDWCRDNVSIAYRTARELVMVGKAEDPQLALEDLRAKTAARNRKAREKKAAQTAAAPKAADNGPVSKDVGSAGRVTHLGPPRQAASPVTASIDMLAALPDKDRLHVLQEHAPGLGMALAPKEELQALQNAARGAEDFPTVAGLQKEIKRLNNADRRKLLHWLSGVVEEDARRDIEGPGDIPEALKAKAKPKGKSKAA